ncbi:MAG TPA: alpha/beta hydrolase [Solirubrobacterales bacterium]|nr:alpha/beta hydrolase [Solirubrobacterales bacterium]
MARDEKEEIMGDDRDGPGGFTSRRIELAGGPIHYREAGDGHPIVFVHGFLANGRLWDRSAAALAGGNRCIVPDWPLGSHPEAMRPDADLTPRGVAGMVSELLAALELDDVTIVGNDSGGAVSQILVTERPERIGRLVLTNCDCFEKFPPGRFKLMARAARLPGASMLLANSMRLRFMRSSPLAYGALTAGPADDEILRSFTEPSINDAGVRRDGIRFFTAADPRDTLAAAARFGELEIPVLLAWGVDDPFFTIGDARRLAAAIPDSTLVEIPGAGTFTALDRPDEVAAAIASFVGDEPRVGSRSA